MTTFPSSSTPTRTGEVCSPPPRRRVTRTARWLLATNARASSGLIRLPFAASRLTEQQPPQRLLHRRARVACVRGSPPRDDGVRPGEHRAVGAEAVGLGEPLALVDQVAVRCHAVAAH